MKAFFCLTFFVLICSLSGPGQTLPSASPTGIDVSKYQGEINWNQVKQAGITFCFIRAGQGKTIIDPFYAQHLAGSSTAGVSTGAYHFFTTNRKGKAQAKKFYKTIRNSNHSLPQVIDIERMDGGTPEEMREQIRAFIQYIERKTGQRPLLYAPEFFYRDHLQDHFRTYPVWMARYRKIGPEFQYWTYWQSSQTGEIPGIKGKVDLNHAQNEEFMPYSRIPGPFPKVIRKSEKRTLELFKERWNWDEIHLYEKTAGAKTQLRIDVLNPMELREYADSDLTAEGLVLIHDLGPTLIGNNKYDSISLSFFEIQGGFVLRQLKVSEE